MKDIIKDIIKRLKSPVVISAITSIPILIVTMVGIEFKDITTWKILFDTIVKVFTNPFILFSICVQIFAFLNNPANKNDF